MKMTVTVDMSFGANNMKGVVKYVGIPENGSDEMIGIALEQWSANASDGTCNGKIYSKQKKENVRKQSYLSLIYI